MPSGSSLLWFRRDLRLRDNAALTAALALGRPVVPVFLLEEPPDRGLAPGAAAQWRLHGSLAALAGELAARGGRLILRRGRAAAELGALARETGATTVFWNRIHEPAAEARDAALAATLADAGVAVWRGDRQLLFDPAEVRNGSGGPFQVFTPFWRHCRNRPPPPRATDALPGRWPAPASWPRGDELDTWALRPRLGWAAEFGRHGEPGEAAARRRLAAFVERSMDAYDRERDRPALDGTSRLSAALHFGELSPRQVWTAVLDASRDSGVQPRSRGAQVFLDELGWREFAHHLLWHFPETPDRPLRGEYATFLWEPDRAIQRAWRRGETGIPIVDAGMRQLWRTGWMHNRVRMIAASYFVKQLLQPWRDGAAWFADTLVDADLANNTLGWQWSAGCGADAAPYFRVFNPVLQGAKFDPEGEYVRRWVPELAGLPAERIHAPWAAEPLELAAAGVRLGHDYPAPLVEPKAGRERALNALAAWRASRGAGDVTGGRARR